MLLATIGMLAAPFDLATRGRVHRATSLGALLIVA